MMVSCILNILDHLIKLFIAELTDTTLTDPIKTEKLGDSKDNCFGFEVR